jgi:predicted phage-related endonuclease
VTNVGTVQKIAITSREQWLNIRMSHLTASDIGSICGVGRRSPLAVWAEKTGRTDPIEDNKVMRKGRWFEPAIFEAIGEERPDWAVRRAKVFLSAADHRLGATPDGVASIPGVDGIVIIQGKVVARPMFREKWLSDPEDDYSGVNIPIDYQLQTLTEAMLAGATTAYVAALVHDTYTADLYLLPVERHPGAEQRILEKVGAFWSDMDAGREPDVMPDKDFETVKALYPNEDGEELDLTGDNEIPTLVEERERLTENLKEDGDAKKAIETIIRSRLRESSSARLIDGRRLTLKITKRAGYSVEPTQFRTLRVAKG